MEKVRPLASAVYSSSSDWPDQNCYSKLSASRRARRKANIFSMMMAHDHTEASSRPDHDHLDDDVGLQKQLQEGEAVGNGSKIHGLGVCIARAGANRRPLLDFRQHKRPAAATATVPELDFLCVPVSGAWDQGHTAA